jgi:hypothetical protein
MAHREAARAAARLQQWPEAGEFLARGAAAHVVMMHKMSLRSALLIDAGFAYWKGGDNTMALKQFYDGIELLEQLQPVSDSDEVFLLHKRIGHTMMWVALVSGGETPRPQFSEPPPGFCSDLDPLPSPRPTPTPFEFILADLIRFESNAGDDGPAFRKYSHRLLSSEYGLLRVRHSEIAIRRFLATLELEELLSVAIEEAYGLAFANTIRANGQLPGTRTSIVSGSARPPLDPQYHELVRVNLVFALFALAARGRLEDLPLANWRTDAARHDFLPSISGFMDLAEGIFVSKVVNAEHLIQSGQGDWTNQLMAAIPVGIADDSGPLLTLQCQALWIHYVGKLPYRKLIEHDIAALVERTWKRLTERPFLFAHPRLSLSEIQTALASPAKGWKKVKEILLAASNSVRLPGNDWSRQAIVDLQD